MNRWLLSATTTTVLGLLAVFGLADGLWTDLPGDITAVGPTASKPDESSGGSAQRFYRVVLR